MAPRCRQRGVVTLIGALFMIVVMAILAQTLNRMSASGLVDAAVQNDSVEALFIAESGVEYASAMYASGTTCTGLSTIGATAAGRGSFDVTNAWLVGSDCRIEVQAGITPLATGAVAATRIIRADLRLSGSEGWAVGNNGAMLQWNGTAWNAVPSGTSENLYAVHCVSVNDCWAAGENSATLHWNGSAWSTVAFPPNASPHGISCPPLTSGDCHAVGYNTFHWNGSNWSATGTAGWIDYYSDIACTSTNCFAVMNGGTIHQSLSAWGIVFNGTTALNGIDCAASDQCWAVGDLSGSNYSFVRYNLGSWSSLTEPAPSQARSNLNAVSCATINDCWAVGDRDNSRYVVVHWDGSSWSESAFQNGQHRENLNGVHCATVSDCWAVGNQRNGWNLIHYDGSSWSYVGSGAAGTQDLNDVYLSSGAGGSVSLVHWQEVVVN
jgi:hypothetical protein